MLDAASGKREVGRRQICLGAVKVLRHKKFHAASMREIASASGMSVGNLYNYFREKEDILLFIHEVMFDRIQECLEVALSRTDNPREQLEEIIRGMFRLASQMKQEAVIVLTETRSLSRTNLRKVLEREAAIVGVLESVIVRGIRDGSFRSDKPKLIANIIASNLWIMPLRGWNILPDHAEDEVLECLTAGLLGMLAAPAAGAGPEAPPRP
jgi:TetR/AcrR family transcriptional regulator, cholesterol catabolism regulator